jgi:hypothetical protein
VHATVSTAGPTRATTSWLDRMQAAFEALPVPWWSPYVAFFLAVQFLGHLGHWLDGTIPMGELQPARNPMYGAFYPRCCLAPCIGSTERQPGASHPSRAPPA